MLGNRKSAITVMRMTVDDRTEKIKKVDIDIFNSGESVIDLKEYRLNEITTNTPIKLHTLDKTTGYMRFVIKVDGLHSQISTMILDSERNLSPQYVEDTETKLGEYLFSAGHYEIGFRLDHPEGAHYINLKVANCKRNPDGTIAFINNDPENEPIIESYTTYVYKFFVLAQTVSQTINMDIPVDTYRDALLNVTKLWLLSGKFDRVRKPNWAGFFDDLLRRYPMTDNGAEQVVEDLRAAIINKVQDIYISDCKAVPNLKDRSWSVSVSSTDTSTQLTTDNLPDSDKTVVLSIDADNVSKVKELDIL